jgi:hypothetical protein
MHKQPIGKLSVVFATLICSLGSALAAEAALPLYELKSGNDKLQGKVLAQDSSRCWLMTPDGRIHQTSITPQSPPRRLSSSFQSWTSSVLRDKLRRELGTQFEAAATRHYIVCAKGSGKARQYAEWFEEVYKTFFLYSSVRGMHLTEPEFPLVAIVFPDQAAFSRYAQQDKVAVTSQLQGYYLNTSNRVALFEKPTRKTADLRLYQPSEPESPLDEPPMWGIAGTRTDQDLYDTIVHEGTHQVAFNTGLHARLGVNPKWVVEGLATVFEAPGIRNASSANSVATRINRERYVWFGNFAKNRRKPNSLEKFITGDTEFTSQTLDAYAQAWALTFFLIETRPQKYAQYLGKLSRRSPLQEYRAADRLADFQSVFGKETRLLEAEFLRFISRLR